MDNVRGHSTAMAAKGLALDRRFLRSGDFREEVAYSAARELLQQSVRPTAPYVANCVMALCVMRAVADLGLRCPEDFSIASTDNISGVRCLRPNLTRSEHPIAAVVNDFGSPPHGPHPRQRRQRAAYHRLSVRADARRSLRAFPGSVADSGNRCLGSGRDSDIGTSPSKQEFRPRSSPDEMHDVSNSGIADQLRIAFEESVIASGM